MQIDVIALDVLKKVGCPFDERDGSRAVTAEEDVQQTSPADHSCDVLVGGTLGKVCNENGTLIVRGYSFMAAKTCTVSRSWFGSVLNNGPNTSVSVCAMQWSGPDQVDTVTDSLGVI
jgi:hypothetical protein